MNRGRASALAPSLVAVFAFACGWGCTKGDENKPVHTYDLRVRPGPQPVGASEELVEAAAPVARPMATSEDLAPGETPPATPVATAKPAATAAPPAPSAKANPDDAVLEQTRVACGRCFSSLPAQAGAPDRSAHVSLTVVPTGTVSRAEVTSDDTAEASVLDCIQQAAASAAFSDNGNGPLRSYAIDVRVHASLPIGGR